MGTPARKHADAVSASASDESLPPGIRLVPIPDWPPAAKWRASMERLQRIFEAASGAPHARLDHWLVVYPPIREGEHGFRTDIRGNEPPGMPPVDSAWHYQVGSIRAEGEWFPFSDDSQTWASLLYGDASTAERFGTLAMEAGELLFQLRRTLYPMLTPTLYLPGCPFTERSASMGLSTKDHWEANNLATWMVLVHELGWTGKGGTPHKFPRYVWHGSECLQFYDDANLAENQRKVGGKQGLGGVSEAVCRANPPPAKRFFSVVERNPFAACAFAIPELLERVYAEEPREAHAQAMLTQPPLASAVDIKARRPILTDEQESLVALIRNSPGMRAKEIGKRMNCSEESVRGFIQRLRKAGVPIQNSRSTGYRLPDGA